MNQKTQQTGQCPIYLKMKQYISEEKVTRQGRPFELTGWSKTSLIKETAKTLVVTLE